jgi:arsenate reductase (thioredoxin)
MEKNRITVLFVCIHNGARSQMAEAFLNSYAGDRFSAKSAGIEPGKLNKIVVAAMKEEGIDISKNKTKSVDNFLDKEIDYIITVCDETSAEKCPFFPGGRHRMHWGFKDPSALHGTPEEILADTRKIRDEIKTKVKNWAEKF